MKDEQLRIALLDSFSNDLDWQSCQDAALALGLDLKEVTRVVLAGYADGLFQVAQHPSGLPEDSMVKITPKGLAKLKESGGRNAPDLPDEPGVDEEFDVFISYASEDRTFVTNLVQELKRQSVSVWFDKDELKLGDVNSKVIERGMAHSRYAVVVLSKAFVSKAYPDHEYHTLLDREIKDEEKVILPILVGEISQIEITKYSPALGNKYNLRASDYSLTDLVKEIVRVVKPPVSEAPTPTPSETYTATVYVPVPPPPTSVTLPGAPVDALPQQPQLLSLQPCLAIEAGNPNSHDGRWYLSWVVRNIGPGVARMIRIFLPGVTVDKLTIPLSSGEKSSRGIVFEDKSAFREFLKPPLQLVAEYEDHAGNIYRQYANVTQRQVPSGAFYAYDIEELARPWLVSSRIIPETY